MLSAVIYARVSSREQEQEGYSIPAQLKLLQEYAKRNGLNVAETFVDVETAKQPGRTHFNAMVTYFKRNRNVRILLAEKTDRLYRNFRDALTVEELDIEVHFVKQGQVLSKDAQSQTKLIHDIQLAISRNYVENLREEVKKGMREKCEQGIYPGHAPFGYRNNKALRNVEPDPQDAPIAQRIFELYASGAHSLKSLKQTVRIETGKLISRANLYLILKNRFYIGVFQWAGQTYPGKHDTYISHDLFDNVQQALSGHNRPRYSKHNIAFRGLMTCAYDGCNVTADFKKGKYTYYRCTGYRGKCDLPRFTELQMSERLGDVFRGIQIPDPVMHQISQALNVEQERIASRAAEQKTQIEQRLSKLRNLMDKAYEDKLSGSIPEDFWNRKMAEWRKQESQMLTNLNAATETNLAERRLTAQRCLELANKAYSLYKSQSAPEQAKLLRMVLSNCHVDAVSIRAEYRKPFDIIFQRAKTEEWSGRLDSN